MSIWFSENLSLEDFIDMGKGSMAETLGIEFIELGPDFLKAKMPVNENTRQPFGILHGGASVVLAETLGSVGAYLSTDSNRFQCVGLDINANHIRPVKQGYVYGTAKPFHLGATTQVWDIQIQDERGKLVCISRLTVAIIKKKS